MENSIKTRRDFIRFLGYSSLTLSQISLLPSCTPKTKKENKFPNTQDDVVLADGLSYYPIISWGDQINKKEVFGFNNDFIALHSLSADKLIMWVNHEYVNPVFASGMERTKANIDIEKSLVGGSLLELRKQDGKWKFVQKSTFNRGVRAHTKIPFANGVKIKGSQIVEGTLGNCAGGKTPWGTFLSGEENYDSFYGERDLQTGEVNTKVSYLKWESIYPQNLPEHYGWVVEIDPFSGKAQKHTNLGRFAHESATTIISKDNKCVVYSGDDKNDQFIYKFISESHKNLKKGTLYVAQLETGKWLPLDLEKSPKLKTYFKSQIDVLTYARKAGEILGATKLHRPEDIEINPITKDVFISLTNQKKKGDFHGSILKISETDANHSSLTFKHETFIAGGENSGFSCPDNMVFDKNGNLWLVNDITGNAIGKAPYTAFGNNGLFIIPAKGPDAGKAIQVGSAPVEAEFTGLCFDPAGETLFVSVQHPGELTKDKNKPTSTWPTGKMPKPTVIAITGPLLEKYTR